MSSALNAATPTTPPNVLSIAGTDPTGGAGIQADLKSISANGGFGMCAVTALVAQNTEGVRSINIPPVSFLREQLDAVSDDVQIDVVKIGMLGPTEITGTVATWLRDIKPAKVVLDPVMVATSGDRLLDQDAEAAVLELISQVDVITPNVPELAVIAGAEPATVWDETVGQAVDVAKRFDVAVLAKGGHLSGDTAYDALVLPDGTVSTISAPRVDTKNTHGTGCSLSSAVATRWAVTGDLETAVRQSKTWLTEALRHADDLNVGRGHGPVHHFAGVWDRGLTPLPEDIATQWWQDIAEIREDVDRLPFVLGLADGSLDPDTFTWYVDQDAIYLNGYSRTLAAASTKAPTQEEQMFWAEAAHGALAEELELHRSFAGEDVGRTDVVPSAVTRAYVDHLTATAAVGSYGEIIAAILPCYWLYRDIGTRFHDVEGDHPYRAWLDTYSDAAFDEATDRAIALVSDYAANHATAEEREKMRTAFYNSSWHELEFFAEPTRRLQH